MTAMRRALLLASLLSACEPAGRGEQLVNSCMQDFECSDDERCDEAEGRCKRERALAPYTYYLQVESTSNPELVARTVSAPRTLDVESELDALTVRRAALVVGTVEGRDGGAIEAEISFARQSGLPAYLRDSRSVYTRRNDGHRFAALLDPSTFYSALAVPLGEAASQHPPRAFEVDSAQRDAGLRYSPLTEIRATLLPDQTITPGGRSPFEGHRVRLRAKEGGAITSSLATLTATGTLTLVVEQTVADNLSAHELVLDLLRDGQPWTATLAVDGRRLSSQGMATITIPAIPARVPMKVRVIDDDKRENRVGADLTFVSNYQPPADGTPMAERDWCRLRNQSSTQPTCSARLSFAVPSGEQEFALFPGYYDVFVTPRDVPTRRFTTLATSENVTPQENGEVLGPVVYKVPPARRYVGRVSNERGAAIAAVSVQAHALGVARPDERATAFNRSASTRSEDDGSYALPLDVGAYDVVAAPREGSGYPWFVLPNRFVSQTGVYNIRIPAPVLVRGSVVDERGAPLYAARVEAFALVPGAQGERPVRVARASSDDAGTFVLYMPPQIGDAPPASLDGGVMDAGRRSDAAR